MHPANVAGLALTLIALASHARAADSGAGTSPELARALLGGWQQISTTSHNGASTDAPEQPKEKREYWFHFDVDEARLLSGGPDEFRSEHRYRWRVVGAQVELSEDDREPVLIPFRFEGDALVLINGRDEDRFVRQDEPDAAISHARPLPTTVAAIVDDLCEHMTADTRARLLALGPDHAIALHFSLGMFVRNHYRLWGGNPEVVSETGRSHPDDASGVVLEQLLRRVREESPFRARLECTEALLEDIQFERNELTGVSAAELVIRLNAALAQAPAAACAPIGIRLSERSNPGFVPSWETWPKEAMPRDSATADLVSEPTEETSVSGAKLIDTLAPSFFGVARFIAPDGALVLDVDPRRPDNEAAEAGQ